VIAANLDEEVIILKLSTHLNFLFLLLSSHRLVNVASRMESTGKAGAIQVTEETCQILQQFGYTFEQRGLVAVKGKGQLMTYYLQGKSAKPPPSPVPTMQTVHEVEEPQPVVNQVPPESPNPLTLSSATASPSSVRLNQNYQPNTDNENDNLESLGSNCEESITDIKSANGNVKHSENDPLLTDSPKSASTNHCSNHFKTDEKDALLENGT
jgi:adenylate cyclase 3